jgi:glyoxylase-like metal-dependent hydrolase (beta-lactamase superfamily II)
MILFPVFSFTAFSNSYIIGSRQGGECAVIDPGHIDQHFINLIEKNAFKLKFILLTHTHSSHTDGVKTLLKIYDAPVYSWAKKLDRLNLVHLKNNENLSFDGIQIKFFHVPGHSFDSVLYLIENMLFTGDSLYAGDIGKTVNDFARENMILSLKRKLIKIEENTIIFPGHGAPSTIKSEFIQNPFLNS